MIILGIDPGIANTGYAIVMRQASNFSVVDSGIIRTAANMSESNRLLKISEKIAALLDSHKISVVAIERIFHNRNISSSITTAEVIGIAQLAAAERELPVYLITPANVKAAVGTPKANKHEIRTRIKLITNSTLQTHHAADAAACAIAAILKSQSCQEKLKAGKKP